jgi:hypothetical protein
VYAYAFSLQCVSKKLVHCCLLLPIHVRNQDDSVLAEPLPNTEESQQQQQQASQAVDSSEVFVVDNDTTAEEEVLVQTTIEAERRDSESSCSN